MAKQLPVDLQLLQQVPQQIPTIKHLLMQIHLKLQLHLKPQPFRQVENLYRYLKYHVITKLSISTIIQVNLYTGGRNQHYALVNLVLMLISLLSCIITGGSKTVPSTDGNTSDGSSGSKAALHFVLFLIFVASCASSVTKFWVFRNYLYIVVLKLFHY